MLLFFLLVIDKTHVPVQNLTIYSAYHDDIIPSMKIWTACLLWCALPTKEVTVQLLGPLQLLAFGIYLMKQHLDMSNLYMQLAYLFRITACKSVTTEAMSNIGHISCSSHDTMSILHAINSLFSSNDDDWLFSKLFSSFRCIFVQE